MFRIIALSYHDSKLLCSQQISAKSSQSSEDCISGRCKRLANAVDCKSDVWAIHQKMSENACASVVSSTIFLTQPWLVFISLQKRLHCWGPHRFALVVTETQDVQNVLVVSLTLLSDNNSCSTSAELCITVGRGESKTGVGISHLITPTNSVRSQRNKRQSILSQCKENTPWASWDKMA